MKAKHNKLLFHREAQKVASSLKPATFCDFVKFANFFCTSIGIQPYHDQLQVSKRKSLLANLTFFAGIINLNLALLSEIVFVVRAFVNGNNFEEATMTMSYIGFVLVGSCKMLFVWRQKSALTGFVNGLKQIFPQNSDLQQSCKLQKYLTKCSRISLSFSLLHMVVNWTFNLLNIIKYVVCNRWLGWQHIEQALPYIMYIPWHWQQHWSYYLLYAAETLAGFTSAAGQISSDLLIVACVTQLIMHFDYVSRKIVEFQCAGQAKAEQKNKEFLRLITLYHSNLLDLTEQMNHIFGAPLLLNFISSSFTICFVGFQITIGTSAETIAKLVLFLFCSIVQLYLICYYGQQLLDVSTNVATAVYAQNWFRADVRYQKMLTLIALRAQKPAQLKATTFVHVSRGTMTELIQISYKFFAVLRTMYANK